MKDEHKKGSLSDTFDTFGAPPKEGAWDAIAAALDEPKNKRRAIIWWWSSGLAAVLILGIITVSLVGNKNVHLTSKQSVNASKKQSHSVAPGKSAIISADETTGKFENNQQSGTQQSSGTTSHFTQGNAIVTPVLHSSTEAIRVVNSSAITAIDSGNPLKSDQVANNNPQDTDSTNASENTLAESTVFDSSNGEISSNHLLTIKVLYPNWRIGLHSEFASGLEQTNTLAVEPQWSGVDSSNFDIYTTPGSTISPVTIKNTGIQLTVGRSLLKSHRLWLESGIHYNSMKSDNHADLGPAKKGYQKHETIGIPIQLSYQCFQFGKWSLSASAGVLNQLVYQTTQKITSNSSISALIAEKPENTFVYHDRFHLISGHIGIDLGYTITPHWQLSVQPQFRYYFGSFHQDSPWLTSIRRGWMGGTVGIRYNFLR